MKKATMQVIGTLLFSIVLGGTINAQIFAPEGLNMPGAWDGTFRNPDAVDSAFQSSTLYSGEITKITTGTTRWQTTFNVAASGANAVGGTREFLFTSGPNSNQYANKWAGVTVTMDSEQSYTYNTGSNNSITITNGKTYVVNWKDNGYAGTDAVFMELSAAPIEISSVELTAYDDDSVTVSITISTAKSTEEEIFVRYSDDSFSTSKHVMATGSGTSYSARVPATSDITYYVLTTTVDLGSDFSTYSDDYDLATIKFDNNSGSNYSYDYGFATQFTSAAGFRLLSSPVTTSYADILDEVWTQGATGGDATNGDPNVFTWDNNAADDANTNWDGITILTNNTTSGEGFLAYIYADDNFDETPDAFPKSISVSGSENAAGASPFLNINPNGWTLLGNPFATTIDFDSLTTSDITGTAYVWDPNAGGSGEWETWNGTTGDLTDGLIAPFQGFFVQSVASPLSLEVTFDADAKVSGGSFYGKLRNQSQIVRFLIEGDNVSNSAFLQFDENGSLTQKVLGDAVELDPLTTTFAKLAFAKSNNLFDIAKINLPEEEVTIPLHFDASVGGSFTLSITDFIVPGDYQLIFHDYQNNVSMNVDGSFIYTFETEALKIQAENPLSIISSGVIEATSASEERFAITIRPASVNTEVGESPVAFGLEQNYPNPFNPSTTISYSIEKAGAVNISVYNLMGQKVATLVDETKSAGQYNIRWNASSVASGMYYYRLEANGQAITRKMTLIK